MARPVGAERLRRLRQSVEQFALALQDDIEHDPAAHLWQVAPMQDSVRHWQHGERDTALGRVAGVVGTIEATLGRLDVALHFLSLAHEILERTLAADPHSESATRDVSVSLNKLGDFLASRGLPGDAEKALGHYERSLEMSEGLLRANPESAQAARDVVVSHYKLAQFGRQSGDEAMTARHLRECHRLLHERISRGVTFDPPIRGLYRQFHEAFGERAP